jgi:hypothetical protein
MNPKSLLPWLLLSCGIAIVSSAPKSQKIQKIQENLITQYTITLEKHTEHRYLLSENGESTQYSKSLRETYYHEYSEKLLSGSSNPEVGYKSWEQYVVDGSEYVGWVALMLVIFFLLWESLWLL